MALWIDFYRPPEYFQLQTLVPRLCLAIGATAIGFCSLIYMNAYCGWLLRIHNLRHCFCSVELFGGMWENGNITGGALSPLLVTMINDGGATSFSWGGGGIKGDKGDNM